VDRFRVPEGHPDEILLSADCGRERALPGGRVVRGKRHLYYSLMRIYEGVFDDEMAARLIGFVRDWATQLTNEFVRVRAGAVVIDGAAIVFPSRPEPHLGTLVGELVRLGASFLGDEVINLDPIRRWVHPLGLPLLIDAEDIAGAFPELGREPPRRARTEPSYPEDMRGITPRRVVSPGELGGSEAGPAPPAWIVLPTFEPGSETRLEPSGGAPALFGFTQSVLNMHVWEDRALVLMRELLESAAVSRLTVGAIPEAARQVLAAAPGMVQGVSA
jgi:hypothetical protein